MQCTDVDCGHQYVVQLGVLRSLMPSAKPDPSISIPLVERRANDIIVARALDTDTGASAASAFGAAQLHASTGFLPAHATN